MYNLFYSRQGGSRGQVTVARFNYLKGLLKQNLDKAIQFHRQNMQAVASDHLLVQLIQSNSVPLYPDHHRFRREITQTALNLGMAFKLTSPLKRGSVFGLGPILGRGSSEIIIADIEDVNVMELDDNWMDLEPVRFIRHNSTNVLHPTLDGRPSGHHGLSVIVVNIPMLLLQYKCWVEAQAAFDVDNDFSIMQFVHQVPLANAMRSYLDVSLFNRCLHMLLDLPINKDRNTNSFHLNDVQDLVQDVYGQVVSLSKERQVDFPNILEGIPLVSAVNMREFVDFGLAINNRQVNWAMTAGHIPVISYLVQVNSQFDGERNRIYLNEIGRTLKVLESDQALRGSLSEAQFDKMLYELDRQIKSFL